jgi:hypothetical protein
VTSEDIPDLDLPDLLRQYRQARPLDPATANDLLNTLRAVFPDCADDTGPQPAAKGNADQHEQESILIQLQSAAEGRASPRVQAKAAMIQCPINAGSLSRTHSRTIAAVEVENEVLPEVRSEESDDEPAEKQSVGKIAEFARKWKQLAPGGADFIGPQRRSRPQKLPVRHRLNVLSWGFGV